MHLERPNLLNKLGKRAAAPLSRVVCSRFLYAPVRAVDAYLNFLLGKGSGTGWDLRHETQLARSRMFTDTPVVFDVGANVGEWSESLIRELPDARIFAFEPSPGCQAHIRKLGIKNVTLIPAAAGEQAGKASLHFSSSTDGTASLHAREDSYFRDRSYHTIEIDVVTIDQIVATNRVPFVDFIKMDIEGHELRALQGARKSLGERLIGALSFEFGSGDINSRTFFRDFWDLLRENGFIISRITPGGRLLPIEDYYEDCEYFRGATNYIAELLHHPKRPK